MITIKYEKRDSSVYIAHVDLLRVHIRALRRARIPVIFSQGFNPHMLLYMSSPAPNGLNSVAEYVTVDTSVTSEDFIARYNENCVKSMRALAVYKTDKNPNIAGMVTHCEYRYDSELNQEQLDKLNRLLECENLPITYLNKNVSVTKDVRSLILKYKISLTGMEFILSSGLQNLRIDRLIKNLTEEIGTEYYPIKILKLKQYKMQDGNLIDVDNILKSLQ